MSRRRCPFCRGEVEIVQVDERNFNISQLPADVELRGRAVIHTLPPCERFDKEDARTFVASLDAN